MKKKLFISVLIVCVMVFMGCNHGNSYGIASNALSNFGTSLSRKSAIKDKKNEVLPQKTENSSEPTNKGQSSDTIQFGETLTKDSLKNLTSEELTIPSTVKKIEEGAFENLPNLKKLTIEEGLESIEKDAFKNSYLTEVSIPASVKTIDKDAFSGAKNISKATIKGGTTVPAGLFKDSKNALTSLTIGDNAKTIEAEAFKDYKNLTNLTLEEGVTSIGKDTFKGSGVQEVSIPKSVTTIEEGAFADTTSLTELTLKEGVKTIGKKAFSNTGLTKVTIPSTVTKIDEDAFSDCKNLTEATVTTENVGIGIVLASTLVTKVTVVGTDSKTILEKAVLSGMEERLATLIIEKSVKTIGKEAFKDYKKLQELTLKDGVTDIGNSAFALSVEGDAELKTVIFPSTVKTIGEYAFEKRKNLTQVSFSEGLEKVKEGAFYKTGIQEVEFPKTVNEIEKEAFNNKTLSSVKVRTDERTWYAKQMIGDEWWAFNLDKAEIGGSGLDGITGYLTNGQHIMSGKEFKNHTGLKLKEEVKK